MKVQVLLAAHDKINLMLNRLLLALIVLLAGAALGLGLGLHLGWNVWPVAYHDTDVSSMRQDYQDEYVVMVATAYSWDGDLGRARARLEQLRGNPAALVDAARERLAKAGTQQPDLQRLNRLALALKAGANPAPSPTVTQTP